MKKETTIPVAGPAYHQKDLASVMVHKNRFYYAPDETIIDFARNKGMIVSRINNTSCVVVKDPEQYAKSLEEIEAYYSNKIWSEKYITALES